MRIVICLTLLSALSAQARLSRLEALGMIESGDNDAAVGQAGEISRYQIQPRIWHQYSDSCEFQNRVVARRVAARHLMELERVFGLGAGRALTDFDLYVLWNAGPTYYRSIGWSRSRVHPIVAERANRFANLCSWNGPPTARAALGRSNTPFASPAGVDSDVDVSRTNALAAALPASLDSPGIAPRRVFALEGVP